jgi:hypothetical protein
MVVLRHQEIVMSVPGPLMPLPCQYQFYSLLPLIVSYTVPLPLLLQYLVRAVIQTFLYTSYYTWTIVSK